MKKIVAAFVISAIALSSSGFAAEVTPAKPIAAPVVTAPQAAKPASSTQQDIININTADAQTLTKLKGIGPKKADAIIAWRKANGSFKSVDQLVDVKGIGPKTVDLNRKNMRI